MKLRFDESLIEDVANRYESSREEDTLIRLQNEIRRKKYINKNGAVTAS